MKIFSVNLLLIRIVVSLNFISSLDNKLKTQIDTLLSKISHLNDEISSQNIKISNLKSDLEQSLQHNSHLTHTLEEYRLRPSLRYSEIIKNTSILPLNPRVYSSYETLSDELTLMSQKYHALSQTHHRTLLK